MTDTNAPSSLNTKARLPKEPVIATAIFCQRLQMPQILINLMNNAFDAAIESDDEWINLDVYDKAELIDISITDSDAGIPVKITNDWRATGLTQAKPAY